MDDESFFAAHRDRMFRLRPAAEAEFEAEFRSLGPHDISRRRIIVSRTFNPIVRITGVKFMPIPFLMFADETVEDDDATLRPIFDVIMREARVEHGL